MQFHFQKRSCCGWHYKVEIQYESFSDRHMYIVVRNDIKSSASLALARVRKLLKDQVRLSYNSMLLHEAT
uniref:Uncharacterized protein n=1 Tax=Acrobeloides nanus TaxID=290746 RepID=A0A914DZ82_9BILA